MPGGRWLHLRTRTARSPAAVANAQGAKGCAPVLDRTVTAPPVLIAPAKLRPGGEFAPPPPTAQSVTRRETAAVRYPELSRFANRGGLRSRPARWRDVSPGVLRAGDPNTLDSVDSSLGAEP